MKKLGNISDLSKAFLILLANCSYLPQAAAYPFRDLLFPFSPEGESAQITNANVCVSVRLCGSLECGNICIILWLQIPLKQLN